MRRDTTRGGTSRQLLVMIVAIAMLSTGSTLEAGAEHRRSQPRLLLTTERQVLTVGPDGGDLRTVAQGGPVHEATWGPGGRIAYAMAWCPGGCTGPVDATVAELHVVDHRGDNDRVVFRLPAGYLWNLSWSPDGQWIAFIAAMPSPTCWGCPPAWDLRVLNLATGAQLTFGPAGEVAWAPDSRRLALAHAGAIHVVDIVAGVVPTRVTATHLQAGSPVWSPDGRHLAFLGQRRATDVSSAPFVWIAASDGSHARRFGTRSWTPPSWSPSGRSIATTTSRYDGIEVTSLDSGARRRLPTPPGSVYDVAWAPDGRALAYLHEGRDWRGWSDWRNRSIRTIRPGGSHDRQIVAGLGSISPPIEWSR